MTVTWRKRKICLPMASLEAVQAEVHHGILRVSLSTSITFSQLSCDWNTYRYLGRDAVSQAKRNLERFKLDS